MRMSCNGCRVLRKGCGEDCIIRPCLQWIKNPESQANATVFLAKFYGRAGLLNLIATGHDNQRPAIFRSLLYEACGRIVNPVYGSVGLLWSGSWHLCQAAVEAVLKGAPIIQMSSETIVKSFDIRHVSKEGCNPLKRSRAVVDGGADEPKRPRVVDAAADYESSSSTSHELLLQEQKPAADVTCSAASSGRHSEETADGSMVTSHDEDPEEVLLDLTLGLAGTTTPTPASRSPGKRCETKIDGGEDDTWAVDLRLDLAA